VQAVKKFARFYLQWVAGLATAHQRLSYAIFSKPITVPEACG